MFVTKIFTFDAAHKLTDYYGKCERLHGHTYKLEVTLEGDVQSNGMVIDFVVLKRVVKKHVIDKVDHQYLNDVIENPSAERVVMWMWGQLKNLSRLLREEMDDPNMAKEVRKLLEDANGNLDTRVFAETLRLHELVLWETPTSKISYHG